MAQGITHGIIRVASGGKFINGFLSATASKSTSAILKQTPLFKKDNLGDLSYTNRVSALAVNMLIGGIVSKASGGSFEQGAVTAAVVFLYNDIADAVLKSNRSLVSNADLISEIARLQAIYGNKKEATVGVSGGAGGVFSFHFLVAGVHVHDNVKYLNGHVYNITTTCCRVGPGLLIGGGTEYVVSVESLNQSNGWSGGISGDMMFETSGTSGSLSASSSGMSVSGSYKMPGMSLGVGAVIGADLCYNRVIKIY